VITAPALPALKSMTPVKFSCRRSDNRPTLKATFGGSGNTGFPIHAVRSRRRTETIPFDPSMLFHIIFTVPSHATCMMELNVNTEWSMTMKKIVLVATVVMIVAFFAIHSVAFAESLRCRDYVERGTLSTMGGTLVEAGHEWILKTEEGIIYKLHLGPADYRNIKEFLLNDGADAVVSGFVHERDIAVTMIERDGQSPIFRDVEGRPARG